MPETAAAVRAPAGAGARPGQRLNDFSIQVATANGSGSQSSNTVLLRALFQMGLPVSGKNLFPSNIAGLPTWYTIRVSREGWIGRKKEIDLLVAMNPETARQDVLGAPAGGGGGLRRAARRWSGLRDDLVCYPVPFDRLVEPVATDPKLRKLLRNMAYVGVLARLLSIEMAEVEAPSARSSARRPGRASSTWPRPGPASNGRATVEKRDDLAVRRLDLNRGKLIVDGNAAARAGGALRRRDGGDLVPHHPLLLAGGVAHRLPAQVPAVGPDGKPTFAVVQAEDELAAHRDGDRGGLGRRARHDRHRRARHLAHERVRRAWATSPRCRR